MDNSRLTVVKHANSISSLLDAISLVQQDTLNPATKGRVVMVIPIGFILDTEDTNKVDIHAEQLRILMAKLILEQQVVVVAGAGEKDEFNQLSNVRTVPAIWSQDPQLNIITTGAVISNPSAYGQALSFSPKGNAITVNAPGDVQRASTDRDTVQRLAGDNPLVGGTRAAAAMTGGLAAYFLSLEGLGDLIRPQRPFIAKAVRDVIVYFAFPRGNGNPFAIANGVKQWDFPKIERDLRKIWN